MLSTDWFVLIIYVEHFEKQLTYVCSIYIIRSLRKHNQIVRGEKMEISEEQLKKRFLELAKRSDVANQFVFTDFLSLAEQSVLLDATFQLPYIKKELFGGMESAERVMVRFGDTQALGYEEPFPITCLEIKPLIEKFAENLTHRDYLGAFMSLGIERSLLGDIVIQGKTAYVFVVSRIADYMIEEIDSIRHTHVSCKVFEGELASFEPRLEMEEHIVSSERLDVVVAKLYHLSRSQSLALFSKQKIFVNGRLFENNSGSVKEGDVVSVRGYGKFRYDGFVKQTKKGKERIRVARYV